MPAKIAVVGGTYWDLIFYGLNHPLRPGGEVRTDRFAMTPGGGSYITAVGLVRLGQQAALWTYVGRDRLGELLLDTMRRERLDVSGVQRHQTLGTAISVAFSSRGDRGFLTYSGCAAATATLVRAWSQSALPRIRHMHFAGVRPPFRPYLRLLDRLRAARITTSLDIGWNPDVYVAPGFRQIVKRMTIFMPSQREARWFTGRAHPGEAVRALAELVPMPVIKLGARGAVGVERGRLVRVRPPRVEAVDTTGAGDAFNAGFLWACLQGAPMTRCLLAGNICGALSTRAPGGTAAFPTLRELGAALLEAAP